MKTTKPTEVEAPTVKVAVPLPPPIPPPPPPPPPAPKIAPPTLGRIVLFTDDIGNTSPAIVNGVNDDGTVSLEVFYRDGVAGKREHARVAHLTDGAHWHWPPRV